MRLFLVALVSTAAFAGAGCGGGGGNPLPTGPTPVSANVEFVVSTSATSTSTWTSTSTATATATEAETATTSSTSLSAECAGLVRLHPSWWSFAHVTMVATEQDRYGLFFDQVPIGRQSVRLTIPEGCASTGLTANGISLEADDTGTFAFTIDSDGRITP